MPIENERKFVLSLGFDPAELHGWTRSEIRQAYLDDGPRLRATDGAFSFTYKRWIPDVGELVEIETELTEEDFALLWSQRISQVTKTRYHKRDVSGDWVVDFLCDGANATYFVIAEVEMPRGVTSPMIVPAEISAHIVHRVGIDDKRFTNKRLADVGVAARLYTEIAAESWG